MKGVRIFGAAFLFLSLARSGPCELYSPPTHHRVTLDLNADWRFLRSDAAGASNVVFDDSAWTNVSLPHTWNNFDGQDGGSNYYRGIGWYRLHVTVDAAYTNRKFFLSFDAANAVADAYVNGSPVGQHIGGYTAFAFDITTNVLVGTDNVFAVRVNNAHNTDIPPLDADFTFFGGIYRPARLLITDKLHVTPLDFGSSGIYIAQTNVSATAASVRVTAKLRNDDVSTRTAEVRCVVVDAASNLVQAFTVTQSLNAASSLDVVQNAAVTNVHLWNGRADPYLYTVFTEINSAGDGVDLQSQRIGFRNFSVNATTGFFLNGQSYDLHGVNIHQDRLNKGWAISDADQVEDVGLIMDIGATAVRLAHYPHPQKTYELCDENGIVAWGEIPLVNNTTASAAFTNNARRMMIEMIRQNYNHPSIAVWGLFNELHADSANTRSIISNLHALAHAEDVSRLTTAAGCCLSEAAPLYFISDTVTHNKYFGWYEGAYGDFGAWADGLHAANPSRAIGVGEYGAGASLLQHRENPPTPGDPNNAVTPHYEEYQSLFHESHWQQMKTRPYLWWKTIWNMCDFASDGRQEGDSAGRNDKGLVTYDRQTRKDAYYWYKAQWSTDLVTHITSARFTPRITNVVEVKVYANADSVQLKINGASQGLLFSTNGIFKWADRNLAEGTNELVAIGIRGEHGATDTTYCVVSRCVNAGGYASGRFAADVSFSGGNSSTSADLIVTSGAIDPAPMEVYQSERYGNFTYSVGGLVPNSNRLVRLHFAEYYWTGAGQRVFNAFINGAQVLTNFDIYAAAGGADKAVIREFKAPANASGQFTIQFTTVTDNAKVSAIEILSIPQPFITLNSPLNGSAYLANTGSSLIVNASVSGGGPTTTTWTQVSGPVPAGIADPSQPSTVFTFPQAGAYLFRLSADNGQAQATTNVVVVVDTNSVVSGLAAHWKFDETSGATAADASGHGLSAACSNATMWTTNGYVNGAINIAGNTNNSVNAHHPSALNNLFTTGGTVCAYFNTASLGGNSLGRLFDKSGGSWLLFNQNSFSNGAMALQFEQTFTNSVAHTTAARKWQTAFVFPTATWTHVAVSYNSGSSTNMPTFYLNGSAVAFTDVSSPVPGATDVRIDDSPQDLYIGNRADAARPFGGRIDDVRIYARPLNAAEIMGILGLPQANAAPTVNAGGPQSTIPGVAILLNGSVSDDGSPNPPGVVSTLWNRISGPGNFVFDAATNLATRVRFDTPGTNILRLEADDTQARVGSSSAITVMDFSAWVNSMGLTGTNAAPDADPDGDRMSTLDEYRAGTIPTNIASCLRILQCGARSNAIHVTWSSVGGKDYVLESTGKLDASFTNIVAVISASNIGDSVESAADFSAQPVQFYRATVSP